MAETNTSNVLSTVFKWSDDKILFLIFGYLKINIELGIDDISSIIFKYLKNFFIDYHINNKKYSNLSYMSDNTIICNFKTIKGSNHYFSNVIFTPFILNLFNNDINKKCIKMCIELLKSDCNNDTKLKLDLWFNWNF